MSKGAGRRSMPLVRRAHVTWLLEMGRAMLSVLLVLLLLLLLQLWLIWLLRVLLIWVVGEGDGINGIDGLVGLVPRLRRCVSHSGSGVDKEKLCSCGSFCCCCY